MNETTNNEYDMSIHTNPDARAWARFFIETKEQNDWGIDDVDEEMMIGWFANAMEAMRDHVNNTRESDE